MKKHERLLEEQQAELTEKFAKKYEERVTKTLPELPLLTEKQIVDKLEESQPPGFSWGLLTPNELKRYFLIAERERQLCLDHLKLRMSIEKKDAVAWLESLKSGKGNEERKKE